MKIMLPQTLFQLRKNRNLRQEDVAGALHMRRQTYGSYENGSRTPPPETLLQLADYYQVTADYLLRGTHPQIPPTLPDNLTPTEKAFLMRFRGLSELGKKEALYYINYLEARFSPIAEGSASFEPQARNAE